MHVYIVLFLIQLPLFLGAPTTNGQAEAEVPACGRCKWDREMTPNRLNETIKFVKKANGCIEAELICNSGHDVYFATGNTRKDTYGEGLRYTWFKKRFNTTISCNGEGPHWELHYLDGKAPTQLKHLFCKKLNPDAYPSG